MIFQCTSTLVFNLLLYLRVTFFYCYLYPKMKLYLCYNLPMVSQNYAARLSFSLQMYISSKYWLPSITNTLYRISCSQLKFTVKHFISRTLEKIQNCLWFEKEPKWFSNMRLILIIWQIQRGASMSSP